MAKPEAEKVDEQQDETEARAPARRTKPEAEKADDGLVEVRQGGEVLRVHPSCVAEHERLGWKAV